jgi:NTP pyrophosphatase (non-canonical NTP hydrolase)
MDRQLKALEQKIIDFRDRRDWAKFHSPKNLSQALGIEAAELQEIRPTVNSSNPAIEKGEAPNTIEFVNSAWVGRG